MVIKIYQYKNYDDYVENQTRTNKLKLHWVYVNKKTINLIAQDKKTANNILCHGTRNGAEQKFFEKHFPNAYIIGTEISDTADQFPMTIQHDFTLPKDEWIGKFDIVYSNSIDHSINPRQTILTWKDQLSNDGHLYLEYSEGQSVCQASDPLSATNNEIRDLIAKAGLTIVNELEGKKRKDLVFVCEKNILLPENSGSIE